MDMDKSLSNKERFDKLKESRQKYKDEAARQREEARSANQKVELLEKQLRMLVAQVDAGEEAKASEPTPEKADGTQHANRIDALTTKVSVLTAELERQKQAAARATNAMHAKPWKRASGAKRARRRRRTPPPPETTAVVSAPRVVSVPRETTPRTSTARFWARPRWPSSGTARCRIPCAPRGERRGKLFFFAKRGDKRGGAGTSSVGTSRLKTHA